MKNFPYKGNPEMVLSSDNPFTSNLFPTSFQEQLLQVYWVKKDLENILHLNTENISDDLTDVSQLLAIVEAQIIRILKLAAKNDAELLEYWGFR
ncbi:hypothetical protein FNO01nite_15790 [Flavobacterium noncentrifugens]|nr:hypothetical protein [Flavobacterium noncentrifugens]GEP50907.1 hypothetical protein FNO01nite_15790 [Flavobacterium noncentrifugens]